MMILSKLEEITAFIMYLVVWFTQLVAFYPPVTTEVPELLLMLSGWAII